MIYKPLLWGCGPFRGTNYLDLLVLSVHFDTAIHSSVVYIKYFHLHSLGEVECYWENGDNHFRRRGKSPHILLYWFAKCISTRNIKSSQPRLQVRFSYVQYWNSLSLEDPWKHILRILWRFGMDLAYLWFMLCNRGLMTQRRLSVVAYIIF